MRIAARRPRWGWHLLLALLMLLMQQASLRHAFSHTPGDEQYPAQGSLCKECLAYAASDHTVTPALPVLALVDSGHRLVSEPARACCPAQAPRFYQTRAPPHPVNA